jgi:uncharacterized repeat protein (TIGR04138 family)
LVDPIIWELARQDGKYAYEAYEFVCDAVSFTQERLGRDERVGDDDRHVCGPELLRGGVELAVREFGLMAPVVFRQWGVTTTADFGDIVFRLIQADKLSRSDRDDPEDFRDVFDLMQALADGFELSAAEYAPRRGER